MASYFLVNASSRAARGISNAPGTRTRSISFFLAPERNSPSIALSKSRSVMKELNRATTTANRLPAPLSSPSMAGIAGSGARSIFNFAFVALLRGASLCPSVSSVLKLLTLLPFKRRRPLFQKCRSPFLLIFGRACYRKQHCLQIQSLAQSHLHTFVYRLHRILHS